MHNIKQAADVSFEKLEVTNATGNTKPPDRDSNIKNIDAGAAQNRKLNKYISYYLARKAVFPSFEEAAKFMEQEKFVKLKKLKVIVLA